MMMSRRPNKNLKEEEFLNKSSVSITEGIYEPTTKSLISWPINEDMNEIAFSNGSDLKKPMLINTSEKEWNTIDEHIKKLNVSKAKWIKHAIYKQLNYEKNSIV